MNGVYLDLLFSSVNNTVTGSGNSGGKTLWLQMRLVGSGASGF
jgi:hypothetical protein